MQQVFLNDSGIANLDAKMSGSPVSVKVVSRFQVLNKSIYVCWSISVVRDIVLAF